MKIALLGYGKMGRQIETVAISRGHAITCRLTSQHLNFDAIDEADLCIEFSAPHSAIENITHAARRHKPIVIGTTGWYEQLPEVEALADQHQVGILYSPNFSVGVQLTLQILSYAGTLINRFEEYDIAAVEYHHNQKKDCPSGTGLAIAETLEKSIDRLTSLPTASVRCGSIPGTHTVLFDSPCDTITITHAARNREGFAHGAVLAAEWLQGKQGLYTFADCFKAL
jgi:4-hydroxy-tetrahydrodipicolinate reductase